LQTAGGTVCKDKKVASTAGGGRGSYTFFKKERANQLIIMKKDNYFISTRGERI